MRNADLKKAKTGSWYFIAGAGGPVSEWVQGYNDLLEKEGIGRPAEWFRTTGAAVNEYVTDLLGTPVHPQDRFPLDLGCLLFPLDGLDAGRLALFKIRMGDRWFDDVVANMRRAPMADH